MKILSCFAESLGFDRDFFTQRHDRNAADYLSTLRLLHYLPLQSAPLPGQWRAGAHSDFDCLTMVFQREGQGGLQVCPGKEVDAQAWTDVVPADDLITCNIGDMLMRWSDDQLKSTLHRVRMPRAEESYGPRYSLAFFCQANSNAEIRSPKNLYPPILASEYLRQRLAANF
jgi:isopenicillin N synthase-like dioxygenase